MIAIDGHTHVYPGISSLRTLIAGGVRLIAAAGSGSCAALLLCEPAGQDVFGQISDEYAHRGRSAANGLWTVIPTNETTSVCIVGPANERIVIVRGQQIVTSERLEVLAIGHNGKVPDGISLHSSIDNARSMGAHVVLPWGAGKWLGRRGRLIDDAIKNLRYPGFHLGDNGGRPSIWAVPQFRQAEESGIKILCGTDPLPIKYDEHRIGTYASKLGGDMDENTPWLSIARLLEDPTESPERMGSAMGIRSFLLSQFKLRARRVQG